MFCFVFFFLKTTSMINYALNVRDIKENNQNTQSTHYTQL